MIIGSTNTGKFYLNPSQDQGFVIPQSLPQNSCVLGEQKYFECCLTLTVRKPQLKSK